jgi:hypothetical protein
MEEIMDLTIQSGNSSAENGQLKNKKLMNEKTKRLVFFICMSLPLILQVLVF